jgi:hypothetical protein
MFDDLLDPEALWSKAIALRRRAQMVDDAPLSHRLFRLADDIVCLAVEIRLATIVGNGVE